MRGVAVLLEAMRPRQWVKNLLVFVGPFFGQRLNTTAGVIESLWAFASFCVVASATYLINDIVDIETDREHPDKRRRPLASGRLSVPTARLAAVGLCAVGLGSAFVLSTGFGCVLLGYLAMTLAYSRWLKHVIIVDLLVLTAGFLLRAAAGAIVAGVAMSDWFLICTTFLALFVAINKRRHELLLLEADAHNHRPVLAEYSSHLLDQMSSVVTACVIMSYALYTVAPETLAKFPHAELLKYSTVCVLFAVFRYMHLVYNKDQGGKPEQLLLSDRPMLVNFLVFVAITVAVVYR